MFKKEDCNTFSFSSKKEFKMASSDTFHVKRFGQETENQENNEQELLQKLKQKIAQKTSVPGKKTAKIVDKQPPLVTPSPETDEKKLTKSEKKKKAAKRKAEKDSEIEFSEKTGFTKLGDFDHQNKAKVRRVLPKWLAEPDIISVDLSDQQLPIEKMAPQIDEFLIKQLKSNGIEHFFPVQRQVIPHLLEQQRLFFRPSDICVSAPTGSGKTLAFVLPIIQTLKDRVVPRVRAMVILPVQDLAMQVYKVFRTYSEKTNLR